MAPTTQVQIDLEHYGFRNIVLWSRGVDLDVFRLQNCQRLDSKPPIFLYVGRVAVEKILRPLSTRRSNAWQKTLLHINDATAQLTLLKLIPME